MASVDWRWLQRLVAEKEKGNCVLINQILMEISYELFKGHVVTSMSFGDCTVKDEEPCAAKQCRTLAG
jgi:hypothetical protein